MVAIKQYSSQMTMDDTATTGIFGVKTKSAVETTAIFEDGLEVI